MSAKQPNPPRFRLLNRNRNRGGFGCFADTSLGACGRLVENELFEGVSKQQHWYSLVFGLLARESVIRSRRTSPVCRPCRTPVPRSAPGPEHSRWSLHTPSS